jgi:hypothetical protein
MSVTTSRVPALANRSLPKPRSHLAAATTVLATYLIDPTVAKLTLVQHAVVFSSLNPTWG